MRLHVLFIIAALFALGTAAQDNNNAYNFLNVTPSSHVYALGGHNVSLVDDDINLVEQNPSLLGPEFDHQIGLSYMKYIGSTNFMGARYGQGLNDHSAIGGAIQYYGYGSMTETDAQGAVLGKFNARDIAFSVTYSHDISAKWRGGITLKYITSKYDEYSAGAIGVDLGVNYYDPSTEFSAGLVIKNLGGQVKKFSNRSDKMPWDVQIGFTKMLKAFPLRFGLTVYGLRHWHLPYYEPADKNNVTSELVERDKFGTNLLRHLVFSAEVLPMQNLYIALGYNYRTRSDMSTYKRSILSGFSIGAGVRVKAFTVGAALAQPHSGATTFMFNLNTSIGELMGR